MELPLPAIRTTDSEFMPHHTRFIRVGPGARFLAVWIALAVSFGAAQQTPRLAAEKSAHTEISFASQIRPLFNKFCLRCHNAETMESGIRLDRLDGSLP